MISEEEKARAKVRHDAHQRRINVINNQIQALCRKRTIHEKIVASERLTMDGIEPCRACKRHVQSPCHDRAGFQSEGPWDGSCRDALYPERTP